MRSKLIFLAFCGTLGVMSSPLGNHDPGQLDRLEVIYPHSVKLLRHSVVTQNQTTYPDM